VPPSESDQWGVFTFQEWTQGALTLEGAVRFESTTHTRLEDPLELDFTGTSVSAGAGYDLTPELSVGASLFRTERAPTPEELFANGPHIATGRFEIGNPEFDIETGTGIEGVVHFARGDAHATLTAFYTQYNDYIFENATGEEEDGLPVFQFAAADTIFTGFEFDGEVTFAQVGSFDLGSDIVVDYVQAEFDEGGPLPRIPPLGVTFGLEAQSRHLALRGEAEWADDQDEITEFELPTDGYTLINLSADFTPFPTDVAGQGLTVSVQANNLGDEEARLHTSFLKDTVPLPGRNFRLAIRYGF
jgi:iron complex outermembrane receptor protein